MRGFRDLQAVYGIDQFVPITWYTSAPYAIPEGNSRFHWYWSSPGTPSAMFGGIAGEVGGLSSGSMYEYYWPVVSAQLGDTSPLAMTAAFQMTSATEGTVAVHIEVTAPVTTTSNLVHFVVCENDAHNQVNLARDMLADETFTLTSVGQTVDIDRSFTLDPAWIVDNLIIVVFVQSHGTTKAVLQACQAQPDFAALIEVVEQPSGLGASWEMDGPGGYHFAGQGDRTLFAWNVGEYTLTWDAVPGWTTPDPNPESQMVAEGDTATFVGEYTDGPFADVAAGALADAGPARGVCFLDCDGDGDPDVYVVNDGAPNLLLQNDGGTFTDVAAGSLADAGSGRAAAWADFDNDGDLDVYLTRDNEANLLLQNDGAGGFADIAAFGAEDGGAGRAVNWIDFDADGLLDLYVVNSGTANRLLKSYGDIGSGWLWLPQSGVTTDAGPGCGAAWADYDLDGDPDLYLANQMGANKLLQNNGALGFFDVTGTGFLADINNGAGVCWVDVNNNGRPDLYLTNDGQADMLADNSAAGFNLIIGAPLGDGGHGRGVVWGDFDLDMDLDCYLARHGEWDRYLRNDGAGVFTSIPVAVAGTDGAANGAAAADYDGDGDLDIYVANENGPNLLLENRLHPYFHHVKVRLIGTTSNASGVGARVTLTAGGVTQTRVVTAGDGYLSQGDLLVHFGLAWHTAIDEITVHWPSGHVNTVADMGVDRVIQITEHETTDVDAPGAGTTPAAFALHPCAPNPFNPSTVIAYDLPASARVSLRVYDLAGRLVRILRDGVVEAAGRHRTTWDGRDESGRAVASGTYCYRLDAERFTALRRMTLIK